VATDEVTDLLEIAIFVVIYFALVNFVFPKLGLQPG